LTGQQGKYDWGRCKKLKKSAASVRGPMKREGSKRNVLKIRKKSFQAGKKEKKRRSSFGSFESVFGVFLGVRSNPGKCKGSKGTKKESVGATGTMLTPKIRGDR